MILNLFSSLFEEFIITELQSNSGTVTLRAAHMNPGATKEQIAADDAIMDGDDF